MLASRRTSEPTAVEAISSGPPTKRRADTASVVVEAEGFSVLGEDVECSTSPVEIGAQESRASQRRMRR